MKVAQQYFESHGHDRHNLSRTLDACGGGPMGETGDLGTPSMIPLPRNSVYKATVLLRLFASQSSTLMASE